MKSFIITLIFVVINLNITYSLIYPIVDTGQEKCFNDNSRINSPHSAEPFYGQDAQHIGNQPDYFDNGDGTITDNVTGLMWSKTPDLNGDGMINIDDKLTYPELLEFIKTFDLAGYNDWRIPSIKELYSLVMFTGLDPSGMSSGERKPFINTDYFEFGYGDESAGEREIDAQMATTTLYKGSALMTDEIMFGYNFADGRIKGYPYGKMPNGEMMDYYVYFVRGNENYGSNDLLDNSDGTITDKATGLMWMKDDSQNGMNWEDALSYAEIKNSENYLGYSDWRLPNAKELQSIVDYNRSLQYTDSPAIDPMFICTEIVDEGGNKNYPFYWTSTTHENMINGTKAVYICFGEALGYMEMPPNSGNYSLMDVHGAGAQRSDPKKGNPDDFPNGHGPQGDVVRIYNYVRLVRDIDQTNSIDHNNQGKILIYPNPANEYLEIDLEQYEDTEFNTDIDINIYNSVGECVISKRMQLTNTKQRISLIGLSAGLYYLKIADIVEKFIKVNE
jgi:hypothetical protein